MLRDKGCMFISKKQLTNLTLLDVSKLIYMQVTMESEMLVVENYLRGTGLFYSIS